MSRRPKPFAGPPTVGGTRAVRLGEPFERAGAHRVLAAAVVGERIFPLLGRRQAQAPRLAIGLRGEPRDIGDRLVAGRGVGEFKIRGPALQVPVVGEQRLDPGLAPLRMRIHEFEELGVGHGLRVESESIDAPGRRRVSVARVQGLHAQEGHI